MVLLFFLYALHFQSFAQDEENFKKFILGEKEEIIQEDHFSEWRLETPHYFYDLNSNGQMESIVFVKESGGDQLHIYNVRRELLYKTSFTSTALTSKIYKILIKPLSDNLLLLLIYYFEGSINYIDDQSIVRLYFLTLEKKDFSSLKIFKGPYYWEKFLSRNGHSHQILKKIKFFDFNKDGILDLLITKNKRTQSFTYRKGLWKIL